MPALDRKELQRMPWRASSGYDEQGRPIPVHIYAGICLVATMYDHGCAAHMVELHNAALERRTPGPGIDLTETMARTLQVGGPRPITQQLPAPALVPGVEF